MNFPLCKKRTELALFYNNDPPKHLEFRLGVLRNSTSCNSKS